MEQNTATTTPSKSPYTGTIGGYLIRQLLASGVGHVFGVPGDYIIAFFKQLTDSKILLIL